MNKYNSNRTGFEVTQGAYRRAMRQNNSPCGCSSGDRRSSEGEPKGTYGETLNRRVGNAVCKGSSSGGCGTQIKSHYGLTDRPLGSVYAPLHEFDGLYDPETALLRGTLFSSLDLPLEVGLGGGKCRG